MTTETLRQAIREWLVQVTGLADEKVLVLRPGGPRQDLPYMTVRLATMGEKVGQDETVVIEAVGGEAAIRIQGERRSSVELEVYGKPWNGTDPGDNVEDFLEAVRSGFNDPLNQILADTLGIAVLDVGTTLDVAELLDTDFEERAQLEMTVGYVECKDLIGPAAGGTIENVDVNGVVYEDQATMTGGVPVEIDYP
jgi:hypothetical protein